MRDVLATYRYSLSASLLRIAAALIAAAFLVSFWRWMTYRRRRRSRSFDGDRQSTDFLIVLILIALLSIAAFLLVTIGRPSLW